MSTINKSNSHREGQSLIEILIAISVGAILIGGAVLAIWVIIDSTVISQQQQTATLLAQEYTGSVRSLAASDWSALYGLATSSANPHMFVSTSTGAIAVPGKEGVVDNNITAGLVGHWGMDESGGLVAYDYTRNTNDGSLEGSPTRVENCRVGRCLDYNGSSDYVAIGSQTHPAEFTYSAWIKRNGGSGARNIISTANSGNTVRRIMFVRSSNNLAWNDLGDGASPGTTVEFTDLPVADGEWMLATVTYDGTTIRGYKNDTASTLTSERTIPSTTQVLNIGRHENSTEYFPGSIDDARIYDRALSASEIEHLYNSDVFTRHFYTENVCRTDDTNFDIAGTVPCDAGQVEDPATLKVTTVIEWPARRGGGTNEFVLEDFVTRWQSQVLDHGDWSAGPGFEGPENVPAGGFSTSSNVDFSDPGKIKIVLPPPEYDLTMAASPSEGGTATDLTGTSPYEEGTEVSIEAIATSTYNFVNWTAATGTFADANATTTIFTMPATSTTVTANFNGEGGGANNIIRPSSDEASVSIDGSTGNCDDGGSFYSCVNDDVLSPNPGDGNYVYSSQDGAEMVFNMSNLSGVSEITEIIVYIYGYSGDTGSKTMNVRLFVGSPGNPITDMTEITPGNGGFGWGSTTFSGLSLTENDINDLILLTRANQTGGSPNSVELRWDVIYVEAN